MHDTYIKNMTKLMEQLSRFTSYVHYVDGRTGFISFRDRDSFLGREEDYKSRIAEEARKELNCSSWKESWIGTGKIAECAKRAMNKAGNLVNKYSQMDFKDRLDPDTSKYHKEAEQVLYDIYRNPAVSESVAFENAVKTFGARYGILSYLFFVKDDTRFLPISAENFDTGFAILEIDYTTSHRCSWENYNGFIDIINEIRVVMEDALPMKGMPRLIDAHSFVWVIQQKKFIDWIPDREQEVQIEQRAEEYIRGLVSGNGGQRRISSNVYIRSAEVAKETRKRANGICQLCNQPAPFKDRNGNPYLEVHHIVWLSRGGADSTENTVALCPNCHTRMHVLDKAEDIEKLKDAIRQNKGK